MNCIIVLLFMIIENKKTSEKFELLYMYRDYELDK